MIKSILKLSFIFSLLISCRVGDDDPLISFRSREARFVNEWKSTKYTSNGVNFTPTEFTFHKDGSGVLFAGNPPEPFNLVWHFVEKTNEYKIKERVHIKLLGSSLPDTWVISKLSHKNIEMETTKLTPIGRITQVLHLKQK